METGRKLLRYTVAGGVFGLICLIVIYAFAFTWDVDEAARTSRMLSGVDIRFEPGTKIRPTVSRDDPSRESWILIPTPSVLVSGNGSMEKVESLKSQLGSQFQDAFGGNDATESEIQLLTAVYTRSNLSQKCEPNAADEATADPLPARIQDGEFVLGLLGTYLHRVRGGHEYDDLAAARENAVRSAQDYFGTNTAGVMCRFAWAEESTDYSGSVLKFTKDNLPYAAIILFFVGLFINAQYYLRYRPRDNTGRMLLVNQLLPLSRFWRIASLSLRGRDRGGFILSRLLGDQSTIANEGRRKRTMGHIKRSLTHEEVESFSFKMPIVYRVIEQVTMLVYLGLSNLFTGPDQTQRLKRERTTRYIIIVLRTIVFVVLFVIAIRMLAVLLAVTTGIYVAPLLPEPSLFEAADAVTIGVRFDTLLGQTAAGLLAAIFMLTAALASVGFKRIGRFRLTDAAPVPMRGIGSLELSKTSRTELIKNSADAEGELGAKSVATRLSARMSERRRDLFELVDKYLADNGRLGLIPTDDILFLSTAKPDELRNVVAVDGRTWDGRPSMRPLFEMPGDMRYHEMNPNISDAELEAVRDAARSNRYAFAWNQRQWRLEWEHRFYLIESIFDTTDSSQVKEEYIYRSEQYHSAGVAREAIPLAWITACIAWLFAYPGHISQHIVSTAATAIGTLIFVVIAWTVMHNLRRIYWYALVKLMFNDISEAFERSSE